MSAIGTKRTYPSALDMSALGVYPVLRDPGGRAVCFIQRALGRRMALDLRDHRDRIALFERFVQSCRAS